MTVLRVRYQTIEFGAVDIHVRTLRDRQEFADIGGAAEKLGVSPASWSLFGVIWPSSEVLARQMIDYDCKGKRILEVGCGIGLTSLLLNHLDADITATDYNPDAAVFLRENTRLNQDRDIPFVRTGWADTDSGLGRFDLILGSDLLYEPDHAELLSGFLNRHAGPNCEIIIVDPGRGNHPRFSRLLSGLGYSHSRSKPTDVSYLAAPFKGQILRFNRCGATPPPGSPG